MSLSISNDQQVEENYPTIAYPYFFQTLAFLLGLMPGTASSLDIQNAKTYVRI